MSYDCEFINYLIIYKYLNVCLLKLRELYSVFANILNFSIIEKFVYRTGHLCLSKICIPRSFSTSGYPNTLGKILYSHFLSAPLLLKNSFIGRTIDHNQASNNLSTISSAYPRIAISIDRSGCYNSKGPALEWYEKRSGGTKAPERRRQTEPRLAKKKRGTARKKKGKTKKRRKEHKKMGTRYDNVTTMIVNNLSVSVEIVQGSRLVR